MCEAGWSIRGCPHPPEYAAVNPGKREAYYPHVSLPPGAEGGKASARVGFLERSIYMLGILVGIFLLVALMLINNVAFYIRFSDALDELRAIERNTNRLPMK